MVLKFSERPGLPEALRAALYPFNPDNFLNHLPTEEKLIVNTARSVGNEPKKLVYAPNPKTPIRVGKKGSDNK